MNIKQLIEQVGGLFTKRSRYEHLLQEIAENFYPERADFTVIRDIGDEYASNLSSSYPLLVRRELGNQIGMFLRPTDKAWFHMGLVDEEREDNDSKRWMQWATNTMRRAMYDRRTQFTRATKEGDHDYAAFGQNVVSCRLNRDADGLLYRDWHLRDCAWTENEEGGFAIFARKWKPQAHELYRLFGDRIGQKAVDRATREPFSTITCYHIMIEAHLYDDDAKGRPYWSIYYNLDDEQEIEIVPQWINEYNIARWQTVSGSQYAYSPAAIAGLPDARLIQAMTYTLLEAGEKFTNPPMIATQNVVKSDISIYAGGVTWVDQEYDERLGQALRPITQDYKGMPMGVEMLRDTRTMLTDAFYLNKLALPQREADMTAYEVGQRVQEYIRGALPIFEPMEMDYNGGLCELTFETMLRAGAFGDPRNMPRNLQGAEFHFRFESPLHDAIEQQKGQKWLEAKAIIAESVALDPSTAGLLDAKEALRDVLEGIGTPAKWMRSKQAVTAYEQRIREQQESEQMLAEMEQGAGITETLAKANTELARTGT